MHARIVNIVSVLNFWQNLWFSWHLGLTENARIVLQRPKQNHDLCRERQLFQEDPNKERICTFQNVKISKPYKERIG